MVGAVNYGKLVKTITLRHPPDKRYPIANGINIQALPQSIHIKKL